MVSWGYAFRRGLVIFLWSIVWGIVGLIVAIIMSGGSLIVLISNPQEISNPQMWLGSMAGIFTGVIIGTLIATIGFYASFVKIILEDIQVKQEKPPSQLIKFGVREAAASGVMAALVCVATYFLIIPIPATQGYFNVGDAMIMVAALTFGPIVGAAAGGFGASLADVLAGYSYFAPFTLLIKGIEGALAGWILIKIKRQGSLKILLAWIVGGLEMVAGYLLTEYFIFGYGSAAFVEVPFNLVQMLVAGIVGIPISLALTRVLKI